MFREGTKPPITKINVVLDGGGLGDNIAKLPAILYVLKRWSYVLMDIWVPDYFVPIAENIITTYGYTERAIVGKFSRLYTDADKNLPTVNSKNNYHTTLKTHLVDYGFHTIADISGVEIADEDKNYPLLNLSGVDISKFNLPEKYIVITTNYTSPVREWPASEINKVAKWCVENGYTPVFMGQDATNHHAKSIIASDRSDDIDFKYGINLINKTSLLEAAKIMSDAKAVCGVDNGLIHLAAMTSVHIVAGYTTVSPATRLPYRWGQIRDNIGVVEPDKELACRYCQSNTHFLYNHRYTFCWYGDRKCTTQMTAEKFISHLRNEVK